MADTIQKDHKFWWTVVAAAISIAVAWGTLAANVKHVETRVMTLDHTTATLRSEVNQLGKDATRADEKFKAIDDKLNRVIRILEDPSKR